MLTSLYDKIKFVQVDESPYISLINKFKKTASSSQLRFIPSLFTFEIFKEVSKYDYLLYLDSDMLIRSDLSDLFKFDHDMIVTPDAGEYNSSDLINTFNGGFMLLANKISSNNYRDKLISHAMGMNNMSLADQTIMNSFFNGKLYSAGINYNCLKRCAYITI
jgi:lipopolysaccharide biosynthesis glycosyltransferase